MILLQAQLLCLPSKASRRPSASAPLRPGQPLTTCPRRLMLSPLSRAQTLPPSQSGLGLAARMLLLMRLLSLLAQHPQLRQALLPVRLCCLPHLARAAASTHGPGLSVSFLAWHHAPSLVGCNSGCPHVLSRSAVRMHALHCSDNIIFACLVVMPASLHLLWMQLRPTVDVQT